MSAAVKPRAREPLVRSESLAVLYRPALLWEQYSADEVAQNSTAKTLTQEIETAAKHKSQPATRRSQMYRQADTAAWLRTVGPSMTDSEDEVGICDERSKTLDAQEESCQYYSVGSAAALHSHPPDDSASGEESCRPSPPLSESNFRLNSSTKLGLKNAGDAAQAKRKPRRVSTAFSTLMGYGRSNGDILLDGACDEKVSRMSRLKHKFVTLFGKK